MATITQVICDKCRSASNVTSVDWEIGRETGQIDLCGNCLRTAIRAVTVSASAKAAPKKPQSDMGLIRAWAKEHGYEVPAKGRIPTDVIMAYQDQNSTRAPNLAEMVS